MDVVIWDDDFYENDGQSMWTCARRIALCSPHFIKNESHKNLKRITQTLSAFE